MLHETDSSDVMCEQYFFNWFKIQKLNLLWLNIIIIMDIKSCLFPIYLFLFVLETGNFEFILCFTN